MPYLCICACEKKVNEEDEEGAYLIAENLDLACSSVYELVGS